MFSEPFSFIGLFIAGIVGVAVGSFLNVVLARLRSGTWWKRGGSRCLSCGFRLRAIDLIPVLSYLGLRGRCRSCGSRFGDAPLVEILTAGLFGLVYVTYGITFEALLFYGLMATIVLIAMYDLEHKIVPDEFSVPFIIISLATILVTGNSIVFDWQSIMYHLVAGVVGGLFFFALWYFSKGRAMGFADGILGFGIGVVLGWPDVISALVVAFWIGAVVSVSLLLAQRLIQRLPRRSRKKVGSFLFGHANHSTLHMKSEVPFGPFLMAGFIIILFTTWRIW